MSAAEKDAPMTKRPSESQTAFAVRCIQAEAWDFGYSCGLGDYGKSDDETRAANPYRNLGEDA